MTREDIIRMAREAGWAIYEDMPYMDVQAVQDALIERLERFSVLVAAAEREACAKVCDLMEQQAEGTECCKWPTPIDCAAAIRARKDKQ